MLHTPYFRLSLCAAMFAVSSMSAQAEVIIDTGPSSGSAINISNYSADDYQTVAGKFTLDKKYLITDVLANFTRGYRTPKVNIAVHGDTNNEPGEKIFDGWITTAHLYDWPIPVWQGLTGLSVILDPGSYWVVFDAEEGVYDYASWSLYGSLNPLEDYKARSQRSNGKWYTFGGKDFGTGPGLQVHGSIIAVPEPSTYAMLGLGLGLLGLVARRRKSA